MEKAPFMKHALPTGAAWFLGLTLWGQTLVLDNFNRPDHTALGGGWTEVESGAPTTIQLQTQQVVCRTGGATGREWFYQDIASYYNPTYQNAGNVVYTWGFNMRQNRTNPSGFNTNNYGVMFVLGNSSASYSTGQGYGVALGNSGTVDPLRLVRFTGGFDANSDLTDLISYGDFGNEYLTVRVDFDVAARKWYLYVHDSTAFRDPTTLTTAHLRDSIVDSTYTGIALPYLGGFYNHASGSSNTAFFDHVVIPDFPASGSSMLAPGSLPQPTTVSSIATSPAVPVWSFVMVDDSLNPAVDADPTTFTALTISAGSRDQFPTWDGVIAGAYLISGTDTAIGTVSGRTITFSGIPTGAGQLGYVPDNGRKEFQLRIWLAGALPAGLRDTADGTPFQFRLVAADITVGAGSTFDPGAAAESDSSKNVFEVTATHLRFRTQPSTVWRGQVMPAFTVGGTDAYGNLDEDFGGAVALAPTFSCPALNGTTPRTAVGGVATFDDIVFYGTLGSGRLVATSSPLTADTSQPFAVKDTASAYHTLAGWDFSDNTRGFQPDVYTPANANTQLDVVGAVWDGAGGSIFGRICGSARTAQWDGGAGTKYYVTRVNTQGYFQIKVISHQRSSPGGPRDFVVQYSFDSLSWTTVGPVDTVQNNCTSGRFEAVLPAVCSDTDTLYIRWLMNSNIRSDGTGNVIPAGANNIYDVSIQGLYYSEARDKYYRSVRNGNFYTGCTWEWSSDSITWTTAELGPDFTSRTVHIRPGHTVTLAEDSLFVDQIVVDSGAVFRTEGMFFLQDGPGADLRVQGTLEVANTSTRTPQWEVGATWQLDTGAAFIKTGNSSAADWRDHYHGGMNTIAFPAQWIIRKAGPTDPTFTTTGSFYPHLIFDNAAGGTWHPTSASSKFTGSTGTAVIKGALRLQNGVVITNANTAADPLQVMGDLRIGAADTFRLEGTGVEVHGIVEVNGGLEAWTTTPYRRLLYAKGDSVIVAGVARLHEWRIYTTDTLHAAGNISVDSLLRIDSGILKTGPTDTIILDSLGQLVEQPEHYLYGTIQVQENLATPGVWYDFANIGVEIQFSGTAPGMTTVVRRTDTFAHANGNRSIRRLVDIRSAVNSGLNATLRISYNDAPAAGEIDTLAEARLDLFRDDGMGWAPQGALLDTALNRLTKTGITAFSLWTAADVAHPLPVELVRFTATPLPNRTVHLEWVTASERDAARFVIERSSDGIRFVPVAGVPARGYATSLSTYAWLDKAPPEGPVTYYRLRMEDWNGTVRYSLERKVRWERSEETTEGTYFVERSFHIRHPGRRFSARLYDAAGRLIRTMTGTGQVELSLEHLPRGLYGVEVTTDTGRTYRLRLVKQ